MTGQAVTQAVGSDGERWGAGAADEASLTLPLLTSCCAARFLTGRGPVPVHGPEVGNPWYMGCFPQNRATITGIMKDEIIIITVVATV